MKLFEPTFTKITTPVYLSTIAALIFVMSSCTTTKKIVYFNNVQDKTIKSKYLNTEPVIQLNDLLSITVSSASAEADARFNAPNESTTNTNSATSSGNTLTIGYLVNQKGDIQFPKLGFVHAAGLNKSQLTAYITEQLLQKELLVDPIVTIRHLNFRVSVLGEVAKPGVFTIPNEKLSMLEAIGLAGDITMYGRKENVLLIREDDKGDKIIKRINLSSQDFFTSPYYYLKSNDVVYVEPSQNRVAQERKLSLVPVFVSLVTLVIVFLNYSK